MFNENLAACIYCEMTINSVMPDDVDPSHIPGLERSSAVIADRYPFPNYSIDPVISEGRYFFDGCDLCGVSGLMEVISVTVTEF